MCVKPGAMLLVGGRSDTYGVLSSAELVTSGGVCRGAVPPLPALRARQLEPNCDAPGRECLIGEPDVWQSTLAIPKPLSQQIRHNSWGEVARATRPP